MWQYKAASGLTAAVEQGALAVTWNGSNGSELRARYAINNGQPIVRELAVRKSGGQWAPLGQNLTPEFYVKSGVRRMTTQQGAPLINLGVDITPEVIEKKKWLAFWDAPFVIPGVAGTKCRREHGGPARGRGQPGRLAERAGGEERDTCRRDPKDASMGCRASRKESERPTRNFRRVRAGSRPTAPGSKSTSRDCRWASSPEACGSPRIGARTCFAWKRSQKPTSRPLRTSSKAG